MQKDLDHLHWVTEEEKASQLASTKTLINVPTKTECTEVMLYFKRMLKTTFITGKVNPIIVVYNAATTEDIKLLYCKNILKKEDTVRVVISTTVGMGIIITNIDRVIHWGSSNICR